MGEPIEVFCLLCGLMYSAKDQFLCGVSPKGVHRFDADDLRALAGGV